MVCTLYTVPTSTCQLIIHNSITYGYYVCVCVINYNISYNLQAIAGSVGTTYTSMYRTRSSSTVILVVRGTYSSVNVSKHDTIRVGTTRTYSYLLVPTRTYRINTYIRNTEIYTYDCTHVQSHLVLYVNMQMDHVAGRYKVDEKFTKTEQNCTFTTHS